MACVAVTVYAGSPERYTAFMTPESYGAVTQYGRVWAEAMMRQPGPKGPLFLMNKTVPRRVSEQAIVKRVHRMAVRAGLATGARRTGRGLRRSWCTGSASSSTCKEALSGDSLASLIRAEYMMGHPGAGHLWP